MSAYTGIRPLVTYTGTPTQKLNQLKALIADPDASQAQAGGGFLDEMSPMAAVQLRVEIDAIIASGV